MDTRVWGVYVRTDDAGRITDINSDEFIADFAGWSLIDEGKGLRYHHAQGNYLDGPLMDGRGVYRYRLVDGEVVERTQEEMDADYVPPVPVVSETELALVELAGMVSELYMAQAELASMVAGGEM